LLAFRSKKRSASVSFSLCAQVHSTSLCTDF
jgi:hypothetical protein